MLTKLTKTTGDLLPIYLTTGTILCLVQMVASISIVNSYRVTGWFPIPVTAIMTLVAFWALSKKNALSNGRAVAWTIGACALICCCSYYLGQNVVTASPEIF